MRSSARNGLLSLERLHNRVVLATACYVMRSADPLICLVREHEKAELSLAIDFTRSCQQSITVLAPAQLKTRIKAAEVELLLKLHKDKPMHGIFYKHLEEHGLSQQLTFSFLRSSGLKSETEGFIMACQDGVFNTLVYRSRVMGVNVPDARCRACRQAPVTLMHLLSACRTYAGTAYVHRHNAALRVLYYHLRHSYGIDETPVLLYAPGNIESVVENERCRIYWNYSFPTLELVQANKPDIVLPDHQQKTMFVIEFSAPAEVNIVSKEDEKRTKYQELLGQLRRLWPDYAVSLLVMVIGSLGGMRNTLLSALRAIPVCRAAAHILAARMQKAVILGTTSPIHSFADDSTLHADIVSNRPISVVELERRRLVTPASLSKDLKAITAWGFENMVEFDASKTWYCTLSNKRCPSGHTVLMNNQALPRSHSFKLLGVSITENMIWHEHVSLIATAAEKSSDIYSEPGSTSHHPTFSRYIQPRPSLEYCSHIWGAAAPITLSILDAVQRRAIRLIGDPALTCHLQPLSHRRAVRDLSLFYRYSNEFAPPN
nr:unnamed protein product [Callosobruchus chinensis]